MIEIPNLINIIIVTLGTIIIAYLYKRTNELLLLTLTGIMWIDLVIRFTDLIGSFFGIILIMNIVVAIIIMYILYKYKTYNLWALYGVFTVFAVIISLMGTYKYNGELIISSIIILWAWYKSAKICWNPFKCKQYNLKII